jgi:hypothetical protein
MRFVFNAIKLVMNSVWCSLRLPKTVASTQK